MRRFLLLSGALLLGLDGTAGAQEGFWDDVRPLGAEVNSGFIEWGPSISADGLTLYFASTRPGGKGDADVYVATRDAVNQPFGNVRNLDEVNTPGEDGHPAISSDGLTLYGCGLVQATRAMTMDQAGNPVTFGEPLGLGVEGCGPSISSDGLSLYFVSRRAPGGNLYVVTRASTDQPFEAANVERLEELNSFSNDSQPTISSDGRAIFFCSAFGGRGGQDDIWWATRARTTDEDGNRVPFEEARNLGAPVNTGFECAPDISSDWPDSGAKLYFVRCLAQNNCDIFQATWHPDCNGNGVDDLDEIRDGDVDDVNANDIPDECEPGPIAVFRRGDSNADGAVNITDATYTLDWLFSEGPEPGCRAALNTNGDDKVDIADPVSVLSFLFGGGLPIIAPYPDCGPGTLPADEELGCANPPRCQ